MCFVVLISNCFELLHLIACIVVDYEVVDRKLVSDLLNKLYGGRQREIVSRLLHICRLYPSLARIDDLAMVWRDIADWMHNKIGIFIAFFSYCFSLIVECCLIVVDYCCFVEDNLGACRREAA